MRRCKNSRCRLASWMCYAGMIALIGCGPIDSGGPFAGRISQHQAVFDILNGEPSEASDYPSTGVLIGHAVLEDGIATSICTATLIADDVVLSAAHCLDGFVPGVRLSYYFSRQRDVSGFHSVDFELPGDAIKIKILIPHPQFRAENFITTPGQELLNAKDLALGILELPLRNVVPAVLVGDNDTSWIQQNAEVEIVGYGMTSPSDEQSAGIKYQARSFINEVGDTEMQIGDSSPTPMKCFGDSGGPTFLSVGDGAQPELRVAGITSHSYGESGCGTGAVDTRVDAFRDWIEQEMIDACSHCDRRSCAHGGRLRQPGEEVFPYEPPDPSSCQQRAAPINLPPDASNDEGCGCTMTTKSQLGWGGVLIFLLMLMRRRAGQKTALFCA